MEEGSKAELVTKILQCLDAPQGYYCTTAVSVVYDGLRKRDDWFHKIEGDPPTRESLRRQRLEVPPGNDNA